MAATRLGNSISNVSQKQKARADKPQQARIIRPSDFYSIST
jgi:hypothetical protein